MSRETVTVVGAGTMGHGIAQVAAMSGHPTRIYDVSEEVLKRADEAIRRNLDKGVEREKVTAAQRESTLENLRFDSYLEPAVTGSDIVIEAAPESLDLKKNLFGEIETYVSANAILATNTSSLPIGRIGEDLNHPERVLGLHFFNPVHIMALLEIVRATATSEEVLSRAKAFGAGLGKECIVVRDVPGFATSRLGLVIGLEAMRMVEQKVASAEDIDKAMTLGYRHPVGPLKLTDMVGLDVRLAIAEHLHTALGSEAFRPPEILRTMVEEGLLGKKTGRGFYDWTG